MGEVLMILFLLAKFIGSVVATVIFLGLATGVLELRQSEQFRRARAGWRAGRGRR